MGAPQMVLAGFNAAAGGGGTDPYWTSVQFLMHADSGFTDSSLSGRTVSVSHGMPAIDTGVKKFGAGSADLTLFDSTPAYGAGLDVSGNVTLPGDLTLEFFAFSPSAGLYMNPQSNMFNAVDEVDVVFGGGGVAEIYATAVDPDNPAVSAGGFDPDVWHHIAWTRASGTNRLFVDGVLQGSYTDATAYVFTTWRLVDGHHDEVRLTVGVARYTANFTPPTAAFPDA